MRHKHCVSPTEASDAFAQHANFARTDKALLHSYDLSYGPFLAPYIDKRVSLLEIGTQNGESLELWRRLFANTSMIAGVSYLARNAPSISYDAMYHGSQANVTFLREIEADLQGRRFNIIIDDGSHVPSHQLSTLAFVFDRLLIEGGMYIIEDLETSYWDKKGGATIYEHYRIRAGIGTRGSAVEKLKQMVDVLNRYYLADPHYAVLPGAVDHQVASVTFSRNCAILHKKVRARWDQVDRADSPALRAKYPGGAAAYRPWALDPKRTLYNKYREANSWDMTTEELV
jgi:hypothetical protein